MTTNWSCWSWKLGLAIWLVIGGAIASSGDRAFAQITPDTTLGNENSTVTSTGAVDSINGGATRGANLFHSFGEFNVEEGRAAVFTNPAGIENILSRVTGGNPSNILGTLGVAGGNANLFLINPNGIIFGPNARLDVSGSFVGTTANAIGFGNQGFFSASNPKNSSSLLTVDPSALLFNQIRAASIENSSVADSGLNLSSEFTAAGLRVPDGKNLLLVGGDIDMNVGGLYAYGGRVELGGLVGMGTVGLNGDGNNLSLSFPDSVDRSDVSLSNGGVVDVTAGDGGSIAINARNLEMTGESFLYAGIESGLGSDNSKAGNIDINATGEINLDNRSSMRNQVLREANGQGGDVSISASTLLVKDGTQVSVSTRGAGKGGNLTVDASDVQIIGTSADGRPSGLFASAERNSTGDAGNLTIQTNTLLVKNGAQILTSTFGTGKGGNLTVDAFDVQIIGRGADNRFASALFASAQPNSTGDAGDLTIQTNTLLVKDGAQVGAGTFGGGKGGNLTVEASDVQIIGTSADGQVASGLFASAERNSTGDAGDLTIQTNTLLVQDGARVTVQSFGTGTAGNMTLNARSIGLNNDGLLSANTRSSRVDPNREQATINVNSQDLIMRRGSNIRTDATGNNVIGGNININSDIIVALENSDISANSANFRGGNVQINASGIFGTQFPDVASDRTSDITATGTSPEFSGTVEINTPDVDLNNGLVSLPAVPVDTQVAQACTPGGSQANSEFVVTGRGGLPPNPGESLKTDAVIVDLAALNSEVDRPSPPSVSSNSTSSASAPIVEAQGWIIAANGEVVLTANVPTVTPHSSWQTPANCHVLKTSS